MSRLRTTLAIALLLSLALSGAAVARREPVPTVPVPEGAQLGQDRDGDSVPRNVSVQTWNTTYGPDGVTRTPGERHVVTVDPDEQDSATPIPKFSLVCARASTGPCATVEQDDRFVVLESDLFPGYECKTGRLTLCRYWWPSVYASYDDQADGAPRRAVSLGPYVVIP